MDSIPRTTSIISLAVGGSLLLGAVVYPEFTDFARWGAVLFPVSHLVLQGVSRRRRFAKPAIIASPAEFVETFSGLHVGVLYVGVNGQIQHLNVVAQEMLGLSGIKESQPSLDQLLKIDAPQSRRPVDGLTQVLRQSPGSTRSWVVTPTRPATPPFLQMEIVPLGEPSGANAGIMLLLHSNPTDDGFNTDAVNLSQDGWKHLMDEFPDLILTFTDAGEIHYANPIARSWLHKFPGYDPRSNRLPPSWLESLRSHAQEINSGQRTTNFSWALRMGKTSRALQCRLLDSSAAESSDQRILFLLARDITVQRNSERDLQWRSHMLRQLSQAQASYLDFDFGEINYALMTEHLLSMIPNAHGIIFSTFDSSRNCMVMRARADRDQTLDVIEGITEWPLQEPFRKVFLQPGLQPLDKDWLFPSLPGTLYSIGLLHQNQALASILIVMPKGAPVHGIDILDALIQNMRLILLRKEIEQVLSENERQYRNLVERAHDGIFIIQNRIIRYANRRFANMLGYHPESIVGLSYYHVLPSTQFAQMDAYFVAEKPIEEQLRETELLHQDRSIIPVEMSVSQTSHQGHTAHLGIVRDLTQRKKVEQQLRYLSFHDKLTGLYNRAFFEEELRRLDVDRELPLSMMLGDVNGLKIVNDTFGHARGDQMLQEAAELLRRQFRQQDIIARWGGDEFAVILPRTSADTAEAICNRIRSAIAEQSEDPLLLSMAFGQSTKEGSEQAIQEVLKEAEGRMYRDKLLQSQSARHAVISSLERSLREIHVETEAHAKRMEELAVAMGHALALPQDTLNELTLLASLHDIGKIAVPEHLILKPTQLNRREWEHVKRHPEIGFRIAQSSPDLAPIADAILSHHEWWNGDGYPQGLAGTDIPLTARMISIVDAFDVMVSGRPYRGPMTSSQAIDELRRFAGIQFDPDLVEILVGLITSGDFHFAHYPAADA